MRRQLPVLSFPTWFAHWTHPPKAHLVVTEMCHRGKPPKGNNHQKAAETQVFLPDERVFPRLFILRHLQKVTRHWMTSSIYLDWAQSPCPAHGSGCRPCPTLTPTTAMFLLMGRPAHPPPLHTHLEEEGVREACHICQDNLPRRVTAAGN